MKRGSWFLAVGTAAVAAGCGPMAVQRGGRTLDAGKTVVGMSAGYHSASSDEDGVESSLNMWPVPQVSVRHGISDTLEAGVGVFPSGLRADGTLGIVRSEAIAIAANVGVSGGHSSNSNIDESESTVSGFGGDAALLATFGLGSLDLNVGARGLFGSTTSKDEDPEFGSDTTKSTQQALGGVVGVTIRRGGVAITPELAVYQVTDKDDGEEAETSMLVFPSVGISVGF